LILLITVSAVSCFPIYNKTWKVGHGLYHVVAYSFLARLLMT